MGKGERAMRKGCMGMREREMGKESMKMREREYEDEGELILNGYVPAG